MGRPSGTHDPREFTHLAKLGADGSVVAIVEIADAAVQTFLDTTDVLHVDVTDLYPYDFGTTKADVRLRPTKPADPVTDGAGVVTPQADAVHQAAMRTFRTQRDAITATARAALKAGNTVARGR